MDVLNPITPEPLPEIENRVEGYSTANPQFLQERIKMKYGVQRVFQENYRDLAFRAMNVELGQKFLELLFENKEEILCISPVKYKTLQQGRELDNISVIRAEVDIEYARQFPIIVTSGYSYDGQTILPPNELTFRQKLKFLFTGKYPIG